MSNIIPFGRWMPDHPEFANPGAITMTNVLPRTAQSYGPAPALSATTGALAARCQGAAYVRDNAAGVWGFAGDAAKLYKNVAGSINWVDISKVGGYSTNPDERWTFMAFGERVVAANYTDPIQSYVMNSSAAFADLAAAAPRARYMTRVREWLMVANTSDPINGPTPQRVWWPAIDDPTNWPTPGSTTAAQLQSDYQDLLGEGGWNQGIVGGLSGADAAIFQERSIWRAMYVGPPAIFSFVPVENARGTPAPGSICPVGPVVYYLADDGFYVFDGLQSVPIGQDEVDRTFFAEVDQGSYYRVTSAADPFNKLVYWFYPGPQSNGGTPNRAMVYHYGVKRWTQIQGQEVEVMARALTTGYTLDQLDSFGTLDDLPFPLDSRAWTGGLLNLAAFDTTHKMALFSGAALAATLDTSEAMLFPDGKAHVSRIWPIVDTDTAQISVGYRDRLKDEVAWTAPSDMTATTGSCPVRANGLYLRARMTIPAGATWKHAQALRFEARAAGRR